ncbi:MAG: ThiF family adenylyltransferase, partial [Pseudomonadota bacterium]
MALSPEELDRHKRHILLKEIGGPGVAKLRAASVSIIGAGALGGPCALYLAAAGIGRIEIWDDDTVDRSNLQRQVQFSDADIGQSKAERLTARLKAQNPAVAVTAVKERFSGASEPTGAILIDASDNFLTRFALNDLAHTSGRYLVSGAASRWSGQVSVFASGIDPSTPCYRCFVPAEPPEAEACDEVGVVGALTGTIGAIMALEAIKLITGAGEALIGRLQIHDALQSSVRTIKLRPDPDCPVCSA